MCIDSRRSNSQFLAVATLSCTVLVLSILLPAIPATAKTTYRDRDSLTVEKRRFPGVLALIHNQLARPTTEIMQARVDALTKQLRASAKALPVLDALADLQSRLGRHAAAIQVAAVVLTKAPKRYESHALMGVIQLRAGHLSKAESHLQRAIKLRPTERTGGIYTAWLLTRYWQSKCGKGKPLPPMPVSHDMYTPQSDGMDALMNQLLDDYAGVLKKTIVAKAPWLTVPPQAIGFAVWLKANGLKHLHSQNAVRGLMLLLHTGSAGSAPTWEALADLLRYDRKPGSGSTRLAAAAYLKAGRLMTDSDARTAYVAKAGRALAGIHGSTLAAHMKRLDAGLKRGASLQARVAKDAARAIAAKQDPSMGFGSGWYGAGSKQVTQLLTFTTPICDKSRWGNLRKRKAVTRAEMLTLAPRAQWHGMTLAGLLARHGTPLCFFRGQWLFPLSGSADIATRGVWVKVTGGKRSAVVRLLQPLP